MSDVIISALISGAVTLIVCLITQSKTRALIIYRLEQLEAKQDKHNSIIERTFILEKDIAVIKDHIDI